MCAYAFVVVFCVFLGFDSLPLSLSCSCALAPCHPSARFVFVCPPSVRAALSLGIIACLRDRSLQLGPFFLLFLWWCLGWENSSHLFYAWVKPQGKKQTFRLLNPQSPWAASSWLETITCMGAFSQVVDERRWGRLYYCLVKLLTEHCSRRTAAINRFNQWLFWSIHCFS